VLVDPYDLQASPASRDLLVRHAAEIDELLLAGGSQALSDSVAQDAVRLITAVR